MEKGLENELYNNKGIDPHRSAGAKGIFSKFKNYIKWGARGIAAAAVIGLVAACSNPALPIPSPKQNSPPKINSTPTEQVYSGSAYNYQVQASDPDGDPLNYSIAVSPSTPSWLSISKTGDITGTAPSESTDKNFGVEVDVSDGQYDVKQDYTLTVKALTNNAAIDFTSIENNYLKNINEGQTFSNIALPATDSAGNSVTYTGVESLDTGVATVSYSGGNTFSITGNDSISADQTGKVKISYIDDGKQGSATLGVEVFNEPDITVTTGSDEDNNTYAGVARVYDSNGNLLPTNKSDSNGNVETSASGATTFQIEKRSDDLTEIILQVGLGTYQPTTNNTTGSYIKTRYLQPKDQSVTVRAVPYGGKYPIPDLNGDGKINSQDYQLFKDFAREVAFPMGFLGKNIVNNVEIMTDSNSAGLADGSSFSSSDITGKVKPMAEDWSEVISNGGMRQGLSVLVYPTDTTTKHWTLSSDGKTIIPNAGWEIVVPVPYNSQLLKTLQGTYADGGTSHYGSGTPYTVGSAVSYLNSSNVTKGVSSHETGLGTVFFGETVTLNPGQTVMNNIVNPNDTPLTYPGTDEKGTQIVKQENYSAGASEDDILGMSFKN